MLRNRIACVTLKLERQALERRGYDPQLWSELRSGLEALGVSFDVHSTPGGT